MPVFNEILDISLPLGPQTVIFPKDPPFERTVVSSPNSPWEVSRLCMGSHTGTHLDVPAHFFPEKARLDDFAAGRFILPAHVVHVPGVNSVQAHHLKDIETAPGEALLFRTRNSDDGLLTGDGFTTDYAFISQEAAEACVARELALVGLDWFTVDQWGNAAAPAHTLLLGAGIMLLEAAKLSAVPAGRYTLICLPLRIVGGEGSPVRAVLAR